MSENKKEIVTEEGFTLNLYPRETKTIELGISIETLEVLEKKAKERDLPLKALLKLYIGQGLRQDMSEEEARDLALKRMKSRKGTAETEKIDLAA